MEITNLLDEYRSGKQTPEQTVASVYDRIESDQTNAWISTRDKADVLDEARALRDPDEKPLYGVPFGIKDNIDYDGLPTTAGCPAYTYNPEESATVVSTLIDAGALLIGKTNMDQFASGLVGTRSPYGICRNVHNESYISGGSSSGSAVAVARGHVAFALGTDTAGSGRVPAALNGLVGLKPTRGLVSMTGVVPACQSLDCVAVFAQSCRDALRVERIAAEYDPADPYARSARSIAGPEASTQDPELSELRVGVPDSSHLEFFGDTEAARLFDSAIETIQAEADAVVAVDFEPFVRTAELLYGGPWVAERLAAVEEFVEAQPEEIHPVIREILAGGREYTAVETFDAFHRLEELKRRREQVCTSGGVDILVTPTTGTVYTVSEILDQPIERNSNLGYYTDYVNLLDLSALSIPAGEFEDGPGFGLTLLGEPGDDRLLATVGFEMKTAFTGCQ